MSLTPAARARDGLLHQLEWVTGQGAISLPS